MFVIPQVGFAWSTARRFDPVLFVITTLLVAAAFLVWRQRHVARARIRRLPGGTQLMRRERRHVLFPWRWSDLRSVRIEPTAGMLYRIAATGRWSWTSNVEGNAAHIDFNCTAEQADELRRRIQSWKTRATAADVTNTAQPAGA
jgi:hypothetical protein